MKVAMKKQLNKDVDKLKTPEKKVLQSNKGVATESSDSVCQASAGWGAMPWFSPKLSILPLSLCFILSTNAYRKILLH